MLIALLKLNRDSSNNHELSGLDLDYAQAHMKVRPHPNPRGPIYFRVNMSCSQSGYVFALGCLVRKRGLRFQDGTGPYMLLCTVALDCASRFAAPCHLVGIVPHLKCRG